LEYYVFTHVRFYLWRDNLWQIKRTTDPHSHDTCSFRAIGRHDEALTSIWHSTPGTFVFPDRLGGELAILFINKHIAIGRQDSVSGLGRGAGVK
jgi:hypothetical protein